MMPQIPLRLGWLPGRYTLARLPATAPWPVALPQRGLVSLTRTEEELSLVVPEAVSLPGAQLEPGWVCLRVLGCLDFTQIGILAGLSTALGDAGISVLAISTFDTDYLLVRESQRSAAAAALTAAGHMLIDSKEEN